MVDADMKTRQSKLWKLGRVMLPSRYVTKIKTSAKRYDRKKERSINKNPKIGEI